MKITEPAMVRSLLRDEAPNYLAPFLHEDHSVAEAAELLQTKLSTVHYWVRSLYDAGLLEVVAQTTRKGRAIKRYRAIASEFVVPAEALPDDYFAAVMRRSNTEMIHALAAAAPEWVIAGDYRISASSPLRGNRARVVRGEQSGLSVHQSGCGLWITEEQAKELVAEISALRDRWIARSEDGADVPLYQLEIALAPIPA